MKNVMITKLVKYIFTENQLQAYWRKLGNDLDYSSLTNEQRMALAQRMLENTSLSALEQHILGHGWRTEDEVEGKMIAEDDSALDVHIEVIDTEQEDQASRLLLDRVMKMGCAACGFSFYVEDINVQPDHLRCPSCQGSVEAIKSKRILRRR